MVIEMRNMYLENKKKSGSKSGRHSTKINMQTLSIEDLDASQKQGSAGKNSNSSQNPV